MTSTPETAVSKLWFSEEIRNAYRAEAQKAASMEKELERARDELRRWSESLGLCILKNGSYDPEERGKGIKLQENIRQIETNIESMNRGVHNRVAAVLSPDLREELNQAIELSGDVLDILWLETRINTRLNQATDRMRAKYDIL